MPPSVCLALHGVNPSFFKKTPTLNEYSCETFDLEPRKDEIMSNIWPEIPKDISY